MSAARAFRAFATASLCLALAAGAAAQDTPPPEKPEKPKDDPILPAEELARVRAELARIENERKKLAGSQAELEVRAKELERAALSGPTSPVLAPRKVVQPMTVRDTIARALENNADLLVEALTADSAQESVPIEEAAFDPILTGEGSFSQANRPNLSNNSFTGLPTGLSKFRVEQWSFTTALEKRWQTGTSTRLEYTDGHSRNNNFFAVNPTYTPRVRGEITQNLLRGFFPNPLAVNNARIRAAEDDGEAADAFYAQRIMEAALQVEQAYWDVVRAEENLKVSESSLKSATELLNDRRKRKELGAATGLEVTVAEAGVAQRRENLIIAENDLEAKRDVLIRLSEPVSREDRYDLFLVPIERPDLIPAADEDVAEAIRVAFARRPDFRRATLQVDAARQRLISAENQALPQVDAFAFVEESGIGTTHDESWRNLGKGDFYAAGGGLRLNLPLFLRSERAQARRARLDLERAEASLRALESEVVLDVRRAVRNIRTARARIEATRTARLLAEKQLAAVKAEVRFGVTVPRQVLDFQADLDSSKNREIAALIDYRVALSALERSKGTILDSFAERLPPRIRRTFAGR